MEHMSDGADCFCLPASVCCRYWAASAKPAAIQWDKAMVRVGKCGRLRPAEVVLLQAPCLSLLAQACRLCISGLLCLIHIHCRSW